MDGRDQANFANPAEASIGANAVFGILRVTRDFGRRGRLGFTATDRERGALHNRVVSVDGRAVFGGTYSSA